MPDDIVLAHVKKLPPLPIVAQRLLTLIQQDTCSAGDITQVLSSDQALAGKILKLANSSFYGMSGKVGTISRAVVILGFSAIRNMALGLGLAQAIRRSASAEALEAFWRHALYTSAAGRVIAREGGHADPEEVFVAGLLHDLGQLLLDVARPGHAASLSNLWIDERIEAEQEAFGMAHTKAGQHVARHWRLPSTLGSAMRFHHHPTQWRHDESQLTACVMLADLVARVLGASDERLNIPPDPVDLARQIGVSLRKTNALLDQVCQEVDHTRTFLEIAGVDTSALTPCCDTVAREPGGDVVFLGNDADRAGWVLGQFGRLGWQPLAMAPFLGDAAVRADLAVIDPLSLQPGQVDKLARILASRGTPIALTVSDPELAARLPGAALLPPAICPELVIRLQPARC